MAAHKPSERTRDTLAPSGFTQQVGAVLRFVQQQVGGEGIVGLALTHVGRWVLLLWALAPRLSALMRRIPTNVQRWFMQYQRWFTLHRLTGLFVVAGLIHGALVDPVLRRSTTLLGWYVAVAAVGTAAYVYRELFLRFFSRRGQTDYPVKAINRLDPRALEVMLAPTARPLQFVAGQFVFVQFGGSAEWERHPFSVSSAPQERDLRLAIEALGDYTQHLCDLL